MFYGDLTVKFPLEHRLMRILLSLAFYFLFFLQLQAQGRKPNIVLIVADDLGVECLSAFGGQSYETPNLDKLARQGMKFSHFFANPYCSPSRAEIITGTYPFHNGVKGLVSTPDNKLFLNPAANIGVASVMKEHGYRSFIAGKWQLSLLKNRDIIKDFGYDSYCCWQIYDEDNIKTNRHYRYTLRTNGVAKKEENKTKYGPDELCDFVIKEIEKSHQKGVPFFAHYSSLLPHWPWVPTPDSQDQTMPKGKNVIPGADLGDKKFLPDMVRYLDKNVGKILDCLQRLKIEDNTIVIFVADNGTDQHDIKSLWNGVVVIGGKGALNDRGTRVPCIVRWTGRVKEGTQCNDLLDLSDLFPTLCDAAGATVKHEIDGRSFYPQLLGMNNKPRDWVFMQIAEGFYIRGKNWIINHEGEIRPVAELHLAPAKNIPRYSPGQIQEVDFLKHQLETLLSEKKIPSDDVTAPNLDTNK